MSTPTSPEDNKALVRQWFAEVDKGEHADFDQFLAPEYLDHNPPPLPVATSGRAAVKEYSAGFRCALRDFHHIVEDQIADSDKVVSRITAYATHTGELLGVPATGEQVTMTGIAIHRIADGRLVEHWSQNDLLGLLQRLGVVPAFSANGAPTPRAVGTVDAQPGDPDVA